VCCLLACGLPGTGAAAGPWDLHCPSTPEEQPTPTAARGAALAFFPWIRPAAKSLGAGPVYLVALSSRTAISRDGDFTDSSGYYLHRALVVVAPGVSGTVVLTGRRLGPPGRRTVLGFSTDGAATCNVARRFVSCGDPLLTFSWALRIAPARGWRIVRTELRIGRTGCFALHASGAGVDETIPLAVPGPDYGSAGW
jgi:hypothetical protein